MGVGTGTAGCNVVREHVSRFCSSGCLCAWLSLHALQRFARASLPFLFFLLSVCMVVIVLSKAFCGVRLLFLFFLLSLCMVVTAGSPEFCESKSPVFVLLVVCVHGFYCILSSVELEHVAFLLFMLSLCKPLLYLCLTKFMPHCLLFHHYLQTQNPKLTLIVTLALNLSPNPNSNVSFDNKQVLKLTVLSSPTSVAAP